MAIPSSVTFYQQNDQYLELDGLTDGLTAAAQNTATVTATLYDSTGAAVTGLQNLTLAFVAASSGMYRGEIVGATFNPPVGSNYTLKVDVTSGTLHAHWEIRASVKIRKT